MERKLILYGSGQIGKRWLEHLGDEKVYSFADSNEEKTGKQINGKEILSIDELCEMKSDADIYISTAYEHKQDIFNLLQSKGLANNVVGSPYLNQELFFPWNTQIDVFSSFEGRNALHAGAKVNMCKMGYASYISFNSVFHNARIGRYTSIGPNVKVIRGQHPTKRFVSTHPMFYSTQQLIHKSFVTENIFEEHWYTKDGYSVEIGNDVWIGDGVSIMEGVNIADGTIVAAGANVVKDTEPYAIVGGNPAKVIRYRFSEEEVEFLLRLKWWNKNEQWIENHAAYFCDINKLMAICDKE